MRRHYYNNLSKFSDASILREIGLTCPSVEILCTIGSQNSTRVQKQKKFYSCVSYFAAFPIKICIVNIFS